VLADSERMLVSCILAPLRRVSVAERRRAIIGAASVISMPTHVFRMRYPFIGRGARAAAPACVTTAAANADR
jgi:hypothetical protein